MELLAISSEISSNAVKMRIQREERKALKPLAVPRPASAQEDPNQDFLEHETLRQDVSKQKEKDFVLFCFVFKWRNLLL